jgi:alpha,alpha-trehalase
MLALFLAFTPAPVDFAQVSTYIQSHWDASVRRDVHESYITATPIPYTVPSPEGNFKALFYWDTYFTNLGLLRSGRLDLAQSNCDALFWWVDRLGYVPNSSFVGDDNRSQPPVLAAMARDVFAASGDVAWLRTAVPRLEREYDFWIGRRTFPGGLAHFGNQASAAYLIKFYDGTLHDRLGVDLAVSRAEKLAVAGNFLAEAESGADFTPVYGHHALAYADVKLNTLLWVAETDLAEFARRLGSGADCEAQWQRRADVRAQAIRSELWDEPSGLFRSRNPVARTFAPVASLDTFYPLWAGLATPAQARRVRANLPRFERAFGLAQTEPYGSGTYQWGYPNGWPPAQWIAARGLEHYGFATDARRVALKYCEAQRTMFAASGHLWEKYDVTTGKPGRAEYAADPMLGWTAGVFLALRDLLGPEPRTAPAGSAVSR